MGKFSALILSLHDKAKADISGATILPAFEVKNPADWCEYYGATVVDGAALLFKAVDKNFKSNRGFLYEPGTLPEAPDWDGKKRECGGGLHFCSTPSAAKQFFPDATRFVGCWVLLKDLVTHKNAEYPNKIKGRKICKPVFEVDIDGNEISE